MSTRPQPRLSEDQDTQITAYRAVSKAAVLGLLLGLLSPVVLISFALLAAPVAGILWNGFFLSWFRRDFHVLIGRKALQAGLILSVFSGATGLTGHLVYGHLIYREARQFALQWFELLGRGEPQKAYQLTLHPASRRPLDERLWDFYREGPRWRKELENYVAPPSPGESPKLVRTLLALGEKARASGGSIRRGTLQVAFGQEAVVRYYRTEGQEKSGGNDVVFQTYAVTYEDDQTGEKKTFFVGLTLERHKLKTGRANWQLRRTEDGFKPEGL